MAFVAPLVAAGVSALGGAAGVSALGAGVTALGTVAGGLAQSASSSYQAQVSAMNAQIANQNAQYAIESGQAKTYQQGQIAAQKAGSVKTALAANGVDVNSGSALDVEAGQRQSGLLDEQTTLNNAELEAYGYRSQATSFQAQSNLENTEATEAPIGAALSATGGLLGSASSLSTKWGGGGSSITPAGSGFGVSP